jgi:D-alanyl-D-alanine carboxypeptidase/D-alanyl-D-alanine-endopeptidase (penicillin-binding protein 4)
MSRANLMKVSVGVVLGAVALTLSTGTGAGATVRAAQPTGSVPPIPGLSADAIEIMNSSPYVNGVWGVKVSDARTGEPLISYHSSMLLEPASVTKTYSTGAAWLKFGPDHRIVTPVVRTGRVTKGVLDGDLVLIAKGDILMGGQTGPDGHVVFANWDHNDANSIPGMMIANNNPLAGLDRLAHQVKARGISEVAGQVVIDDRLFITQDLGENDGPVSPIVINNNLIDLVTTPTAPGRAADIMMRPVVTPWSVVNHVRTVRAGGPTDINVAADEAGRITMTGTIAADAKPALKVWHVADPATFARTAFIGALERAGVAVKSSAVQANSTSSLGSRATVNRLPRVAALTGLPLEQNATYILKVSYNRGAQTQVCLLAVSVGSRNCDDGFPEMGRIFSSAGIDPLGASLVDGSGLPGNYITPDSGAQLMTVFAARPDAARWRAALPIMGVDGSIVDVGVDSPARGKVSAKTGTLGAGDLMNGRLRLETKALSGYVTAKSGRALVLTLIVNQAMFTDINGVFAANDDLGKIATSIWESY